MTLSEFFLLLIQIFWVATIVCSVLSFWVLVTHRAMKKDDLPREEDK